MPILRLDNPVQHYDWGTVDAIPTLLGAGNPKQCPWAELWMGAHRRSPSIAEWSGGRRPLDEIIAGDPETMLGGPVSRRFGPVLPFLFKVLSAARPLSIQAHPSLRKAASGFERENLKSVPLDSPERNYRDPNHKPELLVALGGFEGLCGFRPIPEILRILRLLTPREYGRIAGRLELSPGKAELALLFYRFATYPATLRRELLHFMERRVHRVLEQETDEQLRRALEWVLELKALYPSDVGVLAPLILNLFRLAPGQAVYIGPGQIHAYLRGTGIEVMANSDNVLRAALTSKNVDIPEFLSVLSFESGGLHIFGPEPAGEGLEEYRSPAEEFRLDRIQLTPGMKVGRRAPGPEILLCLEGRALAANRTGENRGGITALSRGHSVFIPADIDRYELSGECLLARAGVSA
ncbi:MAG TPA: mannose-6-phosphate isomerase, class I [Magnetospirillaceae bacterium]|nr:mannose-6-phosphate isomerase, class I [Magnetospirillaceae bacterium]